MQGPVCCLTHLSYEPRCMAELCPMNSARASICCSLAPAVLRCVTSRSLTRCGLVFLPAILRRALAYQCISSASSLHPHPSSRMAASRV